MTVLASLEPLPVEERSKEDPFYRNMEITMQQLGHLTEYRESLNWDKQLDSVELGDDQELLNLKKAAAKNDGWPLMVARLIKKTVFLHVILHPNNKGFYLPFHFEEPFQVNVEGKKVWVGSAPRLAEELKWLEITIKNQSNKELEAFWQNFRDICEKSIKNMTPLELRLA